MMLVSLYVKKNIKQQLQARKHNQDLDKLDTQMRSKRDKSFINEITNESLTGINVTSILWLPDLE